MHSDRTQRDRIEALDGFKAGRYEVLVATDLAARGLDVAGVSHVINYDVPGHPEGLRAPYRSHRDGRRMSATRSPFSRRKTSMRSAKIERFIGMSIPAAQGGELRLSLHALFDESKIPSGGAAKGGRTLKGYSFGRRKK
jgi:ATP-dependent RNA helicase RhlE